MDRKRAVALEVPGRWGPNPHCEGSTGYLRRRLSMCGRRIQGQDVCHRHLKKLRRTAKRQVPSSDLIYGAMHKHARDRRKEYVWPGRKSCALRPLLGAAVLLDEMLIERRRAPVRDDAESFAPTRSRPEADPKDAGEIVDLKVAHFLVSGSCDLPYFFERNPHSLLAVSYT